MGEWGGAGLGRTRVKRELGREAEREPAGRPCLEGGAVRAVQGGGGWAESFPTGDGDLGPPAGCADMWSILVVPSAAHSPWPVVIWGEGVQTRSGAEEERGAPPQARAQLPSAWPSNPRPSWEMGGCLQKPPLQPGCPDGDGWFPQKQGPGSPYPTPRSFLPLNEGIHGGLRPQEAPAGGDSAWDQQSNWEAVLLLGGIAWLCPATTGNKWEGGVPEASPHDALSTSQATPQHPPPEPFLGPGAGGRGDQAPQEDQVPQVLLLQSSADYRPLHKNPSWGGGGRTLLRGRGGGGGMGRSPVTQFGLLGKGQVPLSSAGTGGRLPRRFSLDQLL